MDEKKQRSRFYPGYGLQDCVEWASQIRTKLGSGVQDREAMARAIGSTGLTGASTRKLAALVHFGLLIKESQGYALSPLSERITRPITDDERREGMAEAFFQPDLYREVMDRCQADGRIPAMLPSILVRYHRIQDLATDEAARIFLESGRFAGIIDEDGQIVLRSSPRCTETVPDGASQQRGGAIDLESDELVERVIEAIPSVGTAPQEFRWVLTGGRTACLTVSAGLCANDIRLLKKQIEVLELQAEILESTNAQDADDV